MAAKPSFFVANNVINGHQTATARQDDHRAAEENPISMPNAKDRTVSDKIHCMSSGSSLIADARGRAGLSQGELAERAGTSRTAICAYESGAKDPRAETVERLIRASGFKLVIEAARTWRTVGRSEERRVGKECA